MKQVKNSKRVLWASGAKPSQSTGFAKMGHSLERMKSHESYFHKPKSLAYHCAQKVNLFLSKGCPSKVGLEAQDRPQARSSVSCLEKVYSLDRYSRFEGGCSMDPLKEKPSNVAQIRWKCPPKFVLSYNWYVHAGEESNEAETEKQREMRVLEVVYPRVSDIPHNPSFPMDSEEYHLDDSYIPLIPITPIEEEQAVDLPSDVAPQQNASFEAQTQALPQDLLSTNADATPCDPQPCVNLSASEKPAPEMLPGFQVDVGVAIVAAITAIMKSAEQGSLIDTDLLVKFLSDQKMIEKLISEQVTPDNAKSEPGYGSVPSLVAELIRKDGKLTDAGSMSISGSNLITPSVAVSPLRPDPVIKKLANELGAATNIGVPPLTPSMALPRANTDPVIEKLVQKYREPIDKRVATPSGSYPLSSPKPGPFIDKLIQKHTAPADAAVAAPVSGSHPMTSRVAFPNPRSVPVVKKLIHERGFPNDAGSAPFYAGKLPAPPAFFLPSLKQEEINIKRTIDVYGNLEHKGNDPISRSMPLSNMDVILGASMNSHRLSNMGDAGLRFQGPSPDHERPYLSTLPYLVNPSSQAKAFLPGTAPVSSFSAISAAPPVKDTNYIRSLIRQHGDMHETKDSCLSQSGKSNVHLHDPELVPNLIANELTPRVQILPKSCIYFNSPKGCRNGSNCLYRHDVPRSLQHGSVMEGPGAKRMKIGGVIIGRT